MRLRWFVASMLVLGCGGESSGDDDGPEPTGADSADADADSGDASDDSEADGSTSAPETSGTTPDDDDSETGDDAATDTNGEGPSFDAVYETVLVGRGCTAGYCHGGDVAGLGLTDIETSYAALVGVPASAGACDLSMLVVEGDADTSVLWARLDPADTVAPGCFVKMPKDAEPLTVAESELVKAWIDGGANR